MAQTSHARLCSLAHHPGTLSEFPPQFAYAYAQFAYAYAKTGLLQLLEGQA